MRRLLLRCSKGPAQGDEAAAEHRSPGSPGSNLLLFANGRLFGVGALELAQKLGLPFRLGELDLLPEAMQIFGAELFFSHVAPVYVASEK